MLISIGLLVALLIVAGVAELLYIKYVGTPVPVQEIPRTEIDYGRGEQLRYAVLGDSTAVGQGSGYSKGIAVKTAEYLAAEKQVRLKNFAVSGARFNDVLGKQLPAAAEFKPDIVLIAAGANDVTHFTNPETAAKSLAAIADKLREENRGVKIIITGSPQMGSVPRFPQPIRYLAKVRTSQMNEALTKVAEEKQLTWAPIADETGPIFSRNPGLFAADKFHPNDEGYAVWVPVLKKVFEKSLSG